MKHLFFFILMFISIICFGQNKSAIDQITGVDKYKFGMTLEYYGCTDNNKDKYGQCYFVLDNFYFGGYKIEEVTLNIYKTGNIGIDVIILKFQKLLDQDDIDIILKKLTTKYGSPEKQYVYDVNLREFTDQISKYIWKGNVVQLEFNVDDDYQTLLYYSKGKLVNTDF